MSSCGGTSVQTCGVLFLIDNSSPPIKAGSFTPHVQVLSLLVQLLEHLRKNEKRDKTFWATHGRISSKQQTSGKKEDNQVRMVFYHISLPRAGCKPLWKWRGVTTPRTRLDATLQGSSPPCCTPVGRAEAGPTALPSLPPQRWSSGRFRCFADGC